MNAGLHRMSADTVGALIDAVYAIAVTILALEIPNSVPDGVVGLLDIAELLLEYTVAFLLLFTFWLQHRRITGLVTDIGRFGLLIHAATLLLVCLVPRATTLVFRYGEDVTLTSVLSHFGHWSTAEVVDLMYVVLVVAIDLCLLALLLLNRGFSTDPELPLLARSKYTVTTLLLALEGASFLLPVENRYFLLVVPVAMFFELELSRVVGRIGRPRDQ